MPRNNPELPWTPAETELLVSHASVIAELRDKVERGKASEEEGKRFSKAVFALKKTVEDKECPVDNIILAETTDGKELRFDLNEIREQWKVFYEEHGLENLANLLPKNIALTPKQIETLKAKAREGYTRVILVPAGIENHLQKLKEKLTDGLENDVEGNPIETWFSEDVKPSFPDNIKTKDAKRVGKAYLLLTNPNESLVPGSKNKSADKLIAEFEANGISGLTLADFLIEERKHFEETGKHLVDWSNNEWTWLLENRAGASRVLSALWNPDHHRVRVHSYSADRQNPNLGARSSVVLSIET
ncbi:MAG: hypothetical protein AAB386_00645 [Patescibacteria group bacterium]